MLEFKMGSIKMCTDPLSTKSLTHSTCIFPEQGNSIIKAFHHLSNNHGRYGRKRYKGQMYYIINAYRCAVRNITWQNYKTIFFQYKYHHFRYSDFHYEDKLAMIPMFLYYENSCTGETAAWHWIDYHVSLVTYVLMVHSAAAKTRFKY